MSFCYKTKRRDCQCTRIDKPKPVKFVQVSPHVATFFERAKEAKGRVCCELLRYDGTLTLLEDVKLTYAGTLPNYNYVNLRGDVVSRPSAMNKLFSLQEQVIFQAVVTSEPCLTGYALPQEVKIDLNSIVRIEFGTNISSVNSVYGEVGSISVDDDNEDEGNGGRIIEKKEERRTVFLMIYGRKCRLATYQYKMTLSFQQ